MPELKLIVRIAGTDLDGKRPACIALTRIKGISHNFANAILRSVGVNPQEKLGSIPKEKIAEIERKLDNPELPSWLLNRRKDYETGKDIHLVGSDYTLAQREDIKRLQRIKTWRGLRLARGLKVRGQRTKSTGRKGMAVGVLKKAIKAKQLAQAAMDEKEKKKK